MEAATAFRRDHGPAPIIVRGRGATHAEYPDRSSVSGYDAAQLALDYGGPDTVYVDLLACDAADLVTFAIRGPMVAPWVARMRPTRCSIGRWRLRRLPSERCCVTLAQLRRRRCRAPTRGSRVGAASTTCPWPRTRGLPRRSAPWSRPASVRGRKTDPLDVGATVPSESLARAPRADRSDPNGEDLGTMNGERRDPPRPVRGYYLVAIVRPEDEPVVARCIYGWNEVIGTCLRADGQRAMMVAAPDYSRAVAQRDRIASGLYYCAGVYGTLGDAGRRMIAAPGAEADAIPTVDR